MARVFAVAATAALMAPGMVSAQGGRQFTDAWFWGVQAGGLGYAHVSGDAAVAPAGYGHAPMAGTDWLITRTRSGLLVSFNQAFLTQQTLVIGSASDAEAPPRVVDIKNVRRVDMAMMAFPGRHRVFHPYAGLGFTFQTVGSADPQGPFENPDDATLATEIVQDAKAVVMPLLVVGGQYRLSWASLFGQVSASPSNRNWILYNGRAATVSYELGIRYNLGSSIDR